MKVKFKTKEEQIEALVEFMNTLGEHRYEYETEHEDAGGNYLELLQDSGVTLYDIKNHRHLSDELEEAIKDAEKYGFDEYEIMEMLRMNVNIERGDIRAVTDTFDHYSIGEIEDQVSGISGEVNGEKTDDIFEELLKGLSKADIELVRSELEYYWDGKSDCQYMDTGNASWVAVIDADAFARDVYREIADKNEELYPNLSKLAWERPDSYIGPNWDEHYTIISRHRDSDTLSNFNFKYIEEELEYLAKKYKADEEDIETVRDSHWAVGWVEFIYIKFTAPKEILKWADNMLKELENYPVADDDAYSEFEMEQLAEWFDGNKDAFLDEVVQFIGGKFEERYEAKKLTKREEEDLMTFTFGVFEYDGMMGGVDEAWVGEDQIKTFAESLSDYGECGVELNNVILAMVKEQL